MIKVSVIIPIYNIENYLKKCVDSIIDQTYKNLEIILVDDESPDNCPKMCDEYEKMDLRVKVIHKKNGGLSSARNVGIVSATGEYILFVDGDDWIEKTTVEGFVKLLAEHECDVIVGKIGQDKNFEDTYEQGRDCLVKYIERTNICRCAWRFFLRTDFITSNNLLFENGLLHEDEDWTPRMAMCAKSFCTYSNHFYNYLKREDSITGKPNYKNSLSKLCIAKKFARISNESCYSEYERAFLRKSAFSLAYSAFLIMDLSKYDEYNKLFSEDDALKILIKEYDKSLYRVYSIGKLRGVVNIIRLKKRLIKLIK